MSTEQDKGISTPSEAEIEALRKQAAELQTRVDGYALRYAEMEELVQQYQYQQYQVMGQVIERCLSLRRDYFRLAACRSGSAEDLEAARQADVEWDDFLRVQQKNAEEAAAKNERAALDSDEIDELKKLYRAAAMRCHPDRVNDDEKDSAHDFFLRTQQAYREGDLDELRLINAQLAGRMDGDVVAAADQEALKFLISRLRTRGAELIMAIQSMQLDGAYRRAAQTDRWQSEFAEARRHFETECAVLTERIRACSTQGAETMSSSPT